MTHKQKSDDEAYRGVPLTLAEEWLDRARREMKRRGWSQRTLAEHAGIGQTSVWRVFANQASTVTIARVAGVLDLPDPTEQLRDPGMQRWIYVGTRLNQIAPERFAEILERLGVSVDEHDAADRLVATTDHYINRPADAPATTPAPAKLPRRK